LAVSKQEAQKFDVDIFNLRKVSELEVREKYHIEFSVRFAAVENLNDSEDINRSWENIKIKKKQPCYRPGVAQRVPGS